MTEKRKLVARIVVVSLIVIIAAQKTTLPAGVCRIPAGSNSF
ncbi:MAG: DUF4374 domain-containing protein, partial [Clostridia bacterium]|nr:DUF4374 domain-containing protein [Clostridia bacterium]